MLGGGEGGLEAVAEVDGIIVLPVVVEEGGHGPHCKENVALAVVVDERIEVEEVRVTFVNTNNVIVRRIMRSCVGYMALYFRHVFITGELECYWLE
jgi:hypothetical protein